MTPIDTYPARSSEQNVGRMRSLWQAELQRAGIDGDAEVHYEHRPQEQQPISFGEFAADQFFGRVRTACEHAYVARLSGTPWPTEATVTTSKGGLIGVVKYVIHLPTRVEAPLASNTVPVNSVPSRPSPATTPSGSIATANSAPYSPPRSRSGTRPACSIRGTKSAPRATSSSRRTTAAR
jgi:hypothetical protein